MAHPTLAALSPLKQTLLEVGEGELQVYIASPILKSFSCRRSPKLRNRERLSWLILDNLPDLGQKTLNDCGHQCEEPLNISELDQQERLFWELPRPG